jgi:hypothetical protein
LRRIAARIDFDERTIKPMKKYLEKISFEKIFLEFREARIRLELE